MADRRAQGAAIERAARDFLIRAGLRPLAANVNFRGGELDLVMRDARRGTLVFVEVRHRRSAGFGGGAASVDRGKRRRIVRAAEAFLLMHPQHAQQPCRFDVIEASGDVAAPRLHWIEDAFRADDA